jgi:predicted RNA binding protein YcfA (HicA-like mRNA interferase family)
MKADATGRNEDRTPQSRAPCFRRSSTSMLHPLRSFVAVKVRRLIKLLEEDGWQLERQRGSHRQYRHGEKPGTVTIAGKAGDEVKPGTLASVFRQARLGGRR